MSLSAGRNPLAKQMIVVEERLSTWRETNHHTKHTWRKKVGEHRASAKYSYYSMPPMPSLMTLLMLFGKPQRRLALIANNGTVLLNFNEAAEAGDLGKT